MGLGSFISIVSAAIAAAGAAIAYGNYRRERLRQKIESAKWKREYFSDILKWADESVLVLSEALHLCDLDPQQCEKGKFLSDRHALRIKLWAQVDKGRWFFPNYATDQHGLHKELAYRGYRAAVLNALVRAYRAVTSLDCVNAENNTAARAEIESGGRQFTSEIQEVLAPRTRDEEFRKLTSRVEGGLTKPF
jgi:hypothetical protein